MDTTNEKNNQAGVNSTSTAHSQQQKQTSQPDQKQQEPSNYSFVPDTITRLVMGRPGPKQSAFLTNSSQIEKKPGKLTSTQVEKSLDQHHYAPLVLPPVSQPKRPCRPPLTRKFAHPCTCGVSNYNKQQSQMSLLSSSSGNNNLNSTNHLPPAAYTSPQQLYDPMTKKCLPTSRMRDMLLKECHLPPAILALNSTLASTSTFTAAKPNQQQQLLQQHQSNPNFTNPCYYDDLICDESRLRCVCKPSLHLFYESNQTFGCVPIGPFVSPDGLIHCRPGYVYNVISRECQKVFDVNELPLHYTPVVSATQFSFVTIVLIWVLLLILIVTAKLRKIRTNVYGSASTSSGRRSSSRNRGPISAQSSSRPSWLHPLMAAVNGHQHMNGHRTTVERHPTLSREMTLDDAGSFTDTDFFLANHGRTFNEILGSNNYAGSQLSINNPPPKFEEIYPSCPEERTIQRQNATADLPARPHRLPSDQDLPTYDEAMKMQNTKPPDQKD